MFEDKTSQIVSSGLLRESFNKNSGGFKNGQQSVHPSDTSYPVVDILYQMGEKQFHFVSMQLQLPCMEDGRGYALINNYYQSIQYNTMQLYL